jgi:hypothetical protein
MIRWAKLFAEGMLINRRDLSVAKNYAHWLKEEGCKYYPACAKMEETCHS